MRFVPFIVACSLFALNSPAQAADRGFDLTAGIGFSQIRDKDGPTTFEDGDFAWSLELGYRFTDHFELAVGIADLGTGEDTIAGVDTTIEVDTFNVSGRWVFNPDARAEWYGRLGFVTYRADVDPGGSIFEELFGDDAVELGFGVSVKVSERGSFVAEGRYLNGSDDETGAIATVGYRFHF